MFSSKLYNYLLIFVFLITFYLTGFAEEGMKVVDPERIAMVINTNQSKIDKPAPVDIITEADYMSSLPATENKPTAPELPIQFVLTRQGMILEGIVRNQENSIYIQFIKNEGGITVSKLDVLHVGNTKEELFLYRKHRTRTSDTTDLLNLADWAVRNQLAIPAIQMLREVLENPNYPSRQIIQQKIDQLTLIEKIRIESENRQQAKNTEQVTMGVPIPSSDLERQNWERWAKTIPTAVQDQFLHNVQPILIRRCATTECHGGTYGGEFSLYRTSTGKPLRFKGLQNLGMVLQNVNFQQPASSPILNHPAVTNASGQRIYPFGNDITSMRDYRNFVKWFENVRGKIKEYTPPPAINNTNTIHDKADINPQSDIQQKNNTIKKQNSKVVNSGVVNIEKNNDTPFKMQAGNGTADKKYLAPPNINSTEEVLKRGGLLPTIIPKDVYDPILFNAKYHQNNTNHD